MAPAGAHEQLLGTTNEVTLRLPCDKSNTAVGSNPRQNGTSMSAGKRKAFTWYDIRAVFPLCDSLRALLRRVARLHGACGRSHSSNAFAPCTRYTSCTSRLLLSRVYIPCAMRYTQYCSGVQPIASNCAALGTMPAFIMARAPSAYRSATAFR